MTLAGVSVLLSGATGASRVSGRPVGAAAPSQPQSQPQPQLPRSMAALGDSITQAFDAAPNPVLQSWPQYSWSTGYAGTRTVDSQYLRLLAVDKAIKGHEYDDAVLGAKVSGLASQVDAAIRQRARYVTILIGANDVCTRTIADMTTASAFKATFESDLTALFKGLPAGSHVFVSSIPDIYRLWQRLHTNPIAQEVWSLGKLCQSMLSPSDTATERHTVLLREETLNAVLAQVCKQFRNCRFDDLAVFDVSFTASDINTIDYYHPSVAGQNVLAGVTWSKSWWPRLK